MREIRPAFPVTENHFDILERRKEKEEIHSPRFHELFFGLMWKRKRDVFQVAVFFAIAFLITFWRLTFDCVDVVYMVHSLIIFTDLLLATLFSRSILFNLTLDIIAISHAIWYTYSAQFVTELLETTIMAVAASVYSLMLKFRHRREIEQISHHEDQWYQMHMFLQEKFGATPVEFIIEEFLDGAAGIMYTSFAGLIISELAVLIAPDGNSYLYCIWHNK